MKRKVVKFLLYGFLIVMVLITMLPFIWMVLSSFKSNAEILAYDQKFLPEIFMIENYHRMNATFDFMKFFRNSLFVSITTTVAVAYTSTLCGYVLTKYKFRGRGLLFGLVLSTMMLPWAVTIIPRFSMIRSLGWLDSYKALIIPSLFSSFGIFMMKQNLEALPNEMLEAARMDGANEFYIFHKIVIPMARNGISSIAIFQFLWSWEDYLWPYLVISKKEMQVLSVGLRLFDGQYQTDYGALFAAAAISVIPVIIVYLIFQNRFLEGVASSSVKG